MLGEDHAASYAKIYNYAYILLQTNPDACVMMLADRFTKPKKPLFLRFFVSFVTQKYRFLYGCRPFIGIDGCHLKKLYSGVLLVVMAMDANRGTYLLAICVCEIELVETWGWFQNSCELTLVMEEKSLSLMIRKKKDINALYKVQPNVVIRKCAKHFISNFRCKFLDEKYRRIFQRANKFAKVPDFFEVDEKDKADQ